MSAINTLWHAIISICLPHDEITRVADHMSFDALAQKMRPQILHAPEGAVSLFSYNDPDIRALIIALKYRRRTDVADLFGRCLAEYLLSEARYGESVLVPIPLHPKKERARGFNQSACIAKTASGYLSGSMPTATLLTRTRHAESQTKQRNKSARAQNMRYAFSVNPAADTMKKSVILIDDVATTGATLMDAKRALNSAGIHSVHCIVIASGQ